MSSLDICDLNLEDMVASPKICNPLHQILLTILDSRVLVAQNKEQGVLYLSVIAKPRITNMEVVAWLQQRTSTHWRVFSMARSAFEKRR